MENIPFTLFISDREKELIKDRLPYLKSLKVVIEESKNLKTFIQNNPKHIRLPHGFDIKEFKDIWVQELSSLFHHKKKPLLMDYLWIASSSLVLAEVITRSIPKKWQVKVIIFSRGWKFKKTLERKKNLIQNLSEVIYGNNQYFTKPTNSSKFTNCPFSCNYDFERQMWTQFQKKSQENHFFWNSSYRVLIFFLLLLLLFSNQINRIG